MPRAPRRCPGGNGTCTERIRPPAKYCPEHTKEWMWRHKTASSANTQQREYRRIHDQILERDHHQCQIRYEGRCTGVGDTVDHIRPAAHGGSNHPSNLRAACRPCNEHEGRTEDRKW